MPAPESADGSLHSTLVQIARLLTVRTARPSGSHSEQILRRLTEAAVASVPGADYAGLTMLHRGELVSRAPSDPQISDVDHLQVTLGEGPSVDAIALGTSAVVVVEDFAGETRWSRFSPAVTEHGIRSLLSFPMAPHETSPGALNLYSTRPCAFDELDRTIGTVFAQQAAVALHGAEAVAGLERALQSRDEIGQAKGILIERFGLTEQEAFALLVESSQQTNTKLAAVAHWLVTETRGTRPDPADGVRPRRPKPSVRRGPDTRS